MKGVIFVVFGIVIGALSTIAIVWNVFPAMMFEINESKYQLDETVTMIEQAAVEAGWKVPKIYDIQKSLHDDGHTSMTKLKVISLCKPKYAFSVLGDDNNKHVSAMMPCRISVFEDKEGNVFIGEINIGLMGKMMGAKVSDVMSQVALEEKEILSKIIKNSD